jgi:hypothetical protein
MAKEGQSGLEAIIGALSKVAAEGRDRRRSSAGNPPFCGDPDLRIAAESLTRCMWGGLAAGQTHPAPQIVRSATLGVARKRILSLSKGCGESSEGGRYPPPSSATK